MLLGLHDIDLLPYSLKPTASLPQRKQGTSLALALDARLLAMSAPQVRTQSGSIDRVSGTDAAEVSDLSRSTVVGPPKVAGAANDARHSPDHAANGNANGISDAVAQAGAADGGVLSDGNLRAKQFRRYSTGEDFEASAGPRGKDGYGDADDTRHVGAGSRYYDPRKDVVLRIECATDAQTRVCSQKCTAAPAQIRRRQASCMGHEPC